jgi:hypothetical protein
MLFAAEFHDHHFFVLGSTLLLFEQILKPCDLFSLLISFWLVKNSLLKHGSLKGCQTETPFALNLCEILLRFLQMISYLFEQMVHCFALFIFMRHVYLKRFFQNGLQVESSESVQIGKVEMVIVRFDVGQVILDMRLCRLVHSEYEVDGNEVNAIELVLRHEVRVADLVLALNAERVHRCQLQVRQLLMSLDAIL